MKPKLEDVEFDAPVGDVDAAVSHPLPGSEGWDIGVTKSAALQSHDRLIRMEKLLRLVLHVCGAILFVAMATATAVLMAAVL